MAKYIGVDWASKGWFGVILEDDGWDTDLFPSIWSLWKYHSDATRICIDVPIGLPSEETRPCDVEAKAKLGPRQQSVFYTPTRDAVYMHNLEDAKAANEAEAGFSIQNQAWSIVPRIREVDEFLDMYPSARDRLYETHPEVCFWALNGRTPLPESKRSEAGQEQRIGLLTEEHSAAVDILDGAVETYTTPEYAPLVSGVDDILDALVAALTAKRSNGKRATLPVAPSTDERGLPMQVVYPANVNQTRLSTL